MSDRSEAVVEPVDRRAPSWAAVVGALVVALGFLRGLDRLHDNSFLTHLATGRLIQVDGIPRVDPYSFTAEGEPWVVQSWLVSWFFALVEDLVGLGGIRVVVGLLSAAIVAMLWTSTAAARSIVLRLGVVALALAALLPNIAERPLLVGLVGVGLCVLAIDGRVDPRWLLPMGWVWVSSHGSFPLGLAIVGVAWVGVRLDRGDDRVERQSLVWMVLGLLLGAVNPLGPRLLWFPVELLGRTDLLREHVLEWRAFGLDAPGAYGALAMLLLAAWALVRRWSWRDAGLVLVFAVAALTSRRNIPAAVLVMAPVIARSLPDVGAIRGDRPLGVGRAALVAVAGACLVVAVASLRQPALALDAYPVAFVERLEDADAMGRDAEVRVATEDFVGNYLTFLYGPDAGVFVDDRFDMYPLEILEDYLTLATAEADSGEQEAVLDRYGFDVVLWRRDRPMEEWIESADGWVRGPTDDRYWIACRADSDAAATICGAG